MFTSIPAIPAIASLRPVLAWQSGGDTPVVRLGDVLRLRVAVGLRGELRAGDDSGLSLPLPSDVAALGDELLLRVLTVQPRLELQLLQRRRAGAEASGALQAAGGTGPSGAISATGAASGGLDATLDSTDAMRSDQAWLVRLQAERSSAQPATLASQWRSRVLNEVMAGMELHQAAQTAVETGAPQPHLPAFALQGWNAQGLLLRLIDAHTPLWPEWLDAESNEEEGGETHAREPMSLRLSLRLRLPDGEWVELQLQWRHGLLLAIAAEQPQTLEDLRELMPRIASVLAAVPLLLRHCQLSLKTPISPVVGPEQQAQGLVQGSSSLLFRAAAEIAWVLQQPPEEAAYF